MQTAVVSQLGFVGSEPANCLVFAHRPQETGDLRIVQGLARLAAFAPQAEVFYAVERMSNGRMVLHAQSALAKLRSYVQSGLPVRVAGLPAFINEMMLLLEVQGPLALPPGSWVFTGGGWKKQESRSVSPALFRTKLATLLGLSPENIRDRFGMSEHGIVYLHCPRHRFHIPAYARVMARDPVTLNVLPPGQVGLL